MGKSVKKRDPSNCWDASNIRNASNSKRVDSSSQNDNRNSTDTDTALTPAIARMSSPAANLPPV